MSFSRRSRFNRAMVDSRLYPLIGLLILFGLLPAHSWDASGHQLIAAMAYPRLNPRAQQAVAALAKDLSSPGHPYDAITIACWLDDLRSNDPTLPYHGLFKTWHFIDLGLDPGDPPPSFEPGDDNEMRGNVVQALKRAIVVLQGGTDPYVKTRAMACAMVMHLVGDIHQPLHCATKYFWSHGQERQDAGGNKEEVVNGPIENPRFTLHNFWDTAWRASFDDTTGRVVLDQRYNDTGVHQLENIPALAQELAKQTPPPPGANFDTQIDQWACESNQIARDFVYRRITATENPKYCRVSSGYVAAANARARQRLVLAAYRLAVLLNNTLGSEASISPPASYPPGPPSQSYDTGY